MANFESDKDRYYMDIARAVAQRATCPRRYVGAVIVLDDQIVSTGFNGAPRALPECHNVGCEILHGHCVRTVHAEANAVIQAATNGVSTKGATLYTTASPCRSCMSAIINARISRVVYCDKYQDPTHEEDKSLWALQAAEKVGIKMDWLNEVKL